jgi:hypothetical protein
MKATIVGRSLGDCSTYGVTEKYGLAVTHVKIASRSAKPRTHAA